MKTSTLLQLKGSRAEVLKAASNSVRMATDVLQYTETDKGDVAGGRNETVAIAG